jgi:hypothetical protein
MYGTYQRNYIEPLNLVRALSVGPGVQLVRFKLADPKTSQLVLRSPCCNVSHVDQTMVLASTAEIKLMKLSSMPPCNVHNWDRSDVCIP